MDLYVEVDLDNLLRWQATSLLIQKPRFDLRPMRIVFLVVKWNTFFSQVCQYYSISAPFSYFIQPPVMLHNLSK